MDLRTLRYVLLTAAAGLPALFAAEEPRYIDAVAARVNDTIITVYDITSETRPVEAELSQRLSGEELREEIVGLRNQMAERLVNQELIYAEFREKGYTVPPSAVQRRVNRIVQRRSGGDVEAFEEQLRQQDLTMAEFEDKVRKQLAVELLVEERVRRPVRVGPQEVEAYYRNHRDELPVPDRYELQVISVSREDRSEEEVDERLTAIRQALQNGAPFAEVAKTYSDDTWSREKGGNVGWIEEKDLDEKTREAVRNLDAGDVTEPVPGENDVRIWRVADVERGGMPALDQDLRQRLEERLRSRKEDRRYEEFLSKLREKFFVRTYF